MIQWSDVKDYCKERLEEIKKINKTYPCPSGFVCIAAFVAYLSRLAYGTNVKTDRHDGDWFKKFVTNFMPPKYNGHEDLMYRTFRCGILHSMSFDDEISDNRTVYLAQQGGSTSGCSELSITHDTAFSSLCVGGQLTKESTTQSYVFVADVLCDDIKKAIDTMFNSVAVQRNAEEFTNCQRFISNIRVPTPSAQTAGASSCSTSVHEISASN